MFKLKLSDSAQPIPRPAIRVPSIRIAGTTLTGTTLTGTTLTGTTLTGTTLTGTTLACLDLYRRLNQQYPSPVFLRSFVNC
ncbi:MAG: hypothetical protein GY924_02425 [Planctomycetaceae bacterium]|nr:hypothetical protein [Planctomycetaceae bacterium]